MTSDSTDRADAAADFADVVFAGEPWTVSALARAIAERDARLQQRERDRMAGLLRAAWAMYDVPHVVQVREDGWGLSHPLGCRPALTECLVHRAAMQWDGPPAPVGQYRVSPLGVIGDAYDLPDQALALRAELVALAPEVEGD